MKGKIETIFLCYTALSAEAVADVYFCIVVLLGSDSYVWRRTDILVVFEKWTK